MSEYFVSTSFFCWTRRPEPKPPSPHCAELKHEPISGGESNPTKTDKPSLQGVTELRMMSIKLSLAFRTYVPVKSWIKANKGKVLIYNPSFLKYIYDSWLEGNGRYPSTGFLSLMFAVHICDEVKVFGFGADQDGNWHHYWEDNKLGGAFRQTGVHDGDFEYNITLLLADKHKITLYRGG
ncbi:CMP-N-acetylneuraminate-beta-galactosamide-alpha-2,3-sialyltransferase 1-like [Carassius auratus]|uniref:CMP-N-acetylneuraminate-beta-galactosamide- alpha-2,3-sialyltransferase 1-like n=1 Tax=Carassius auratus TaxID=7957 RepID=A0A6P6MV24_CARAU|nr:CMP-N-acetylneuraminate-beta-galactosamide-alpha-2,3-sialyltransferase 1-like [Carassius auratus]